jgi:uncharacterized protein YneF (UPF0154 family)
MQKEKTIITITSSLIVGLILGAIFFSKETSIYAQPDLLTEQARVLESCMQGYDRTLKLLGEANELLNKLTQ